MKENAISINECRHHYAQLDKMCHQYLQVLVGGGEEMTTLTLVFLYIDARIWFIFGNVTSPGHKNRQNTMRATGLCRHVFV